MGSASCAEPRRRRGEVLSSPAHHRLSLWRKERAPGRSSAPQYGQYVMAGILLSGLGPSFHITRIPCFPSPVIGRTWADCCHFVGIWIVEALRFFIVPCLEKENYFHSRVTYVVDWSVILYKTQGFSQRVKVFHVFVTAPFKKPPHASGRQTCRGFVKKRMVACWANCPSTWHMPRFMAFSVWDLAVKRRAS